MELREWALIIFTIMAQMSVGAFIVLGILHTYALRKAGVAEADRMSDFALLAIGPVLFLGLAASIFHLGNPMRAMYSVLNVNSSWLSREILFGVLFAGFGFVFAFLQWRKLGSQGLRQVLAWITAAIGLVLVYVMSRVYMIPTQPVWNTWVTPVLFYVTTFLLGLFAVGLALFINFRYVQRQAPGCADVQCDLLQTAIRGIALASLVLLGIELVTIPLQLTLLGGSAVPEASSSLGLIASQFGLWFTLRLILVFVGAGLFSFLIYRQSLTAMPDSTLANMVVSAFLLVLTAEVIGRFLFYATTVQLGL
jgi:anaerobic dimethyl sulfoxide reductase subunit C (anchor subunit)